MSTTPRRFVIAVIAVIAVTVLVAGTAVGRHLLGRSVNTGSHASSTSAGSRSASGGAVPSDRAQSSPATRQGFAASPGFPITGTKGATGSTATGSTGVTGSQTPATGGALPSVPVFAITPQIVRTATIDLRVGKNTLGSTLTNVAELAAADGGYVESSSTGGGTAQSAPVSGSIVIHVLDSDFSQAMSTLSGYGKVTDQQFQGRDVTNQVSENAATIQVLQEEVNLLQGKLAQATDISTFLQIQNQLFPVEQQLQQLQNQQTVLENSAAYATITANLSAPGVAVAPAPRPRPNANAATVAWRYLRHNSLAVLDGLVVGGSWALPVLALLALVWLAGTRVVRRRRHAVNPA